MEVEGSCCGLKVVDGDGRCSVLVGGWWRLVYSMVRFCIKFATVLC